MNLISNKSEIELDASQFRSDKQLHNVAKIVSKHAKKERKLFRKTEEPINSVLLNIPTYWSDSVPWFEWMTDFEVLESCAEECGVQMNKLVKMIACEIRPTNWQVFFWLSVRRQRV